MFNCFLATPVVSRKLWRRAEVECSERAWFTGDILSRKVSSPKSLVETSVTFLLKDGAHLLQDLGHLRVTAVARSSNIGNSGDGSPFQRQLDHCATMDFGVFFNQGAHQTSRVPSQDIDDVPFERMR